MVCLSLELDPVVVVIVAIDTGPRGGADWFLCMFVVKGGGVAVCQSTDAVGLSCQNTNTVGLSCQNTYAVGLSCQSTYAVDWSCQSTDTVGLSCQSTVQC